MARIRTIKPEFCTSEQVADCSPNARLLFVCMWCFCDDSGVHVDSAKRLKMEVFPADDFTAVDIAAMVDELVGAGLLERYDVAGTSYLRVTGWQKHQKIDQPNYRHPLPNGEIPNAPSRRGGGNSPNGRRTPDDEKPNAPPAPDDGSPNTPRTDGERSPPEWNGKESKGESTAAAKPQATRGRAREAAVEPPREPWRDVGVAACDLLEKPTWTYGVVRQWMADGADPETHILAVIREKIADGTAARAQSLSYFGPAIKQRMERPPAGVAVPSPDGDSPARRQWRGRLERFRNSGFWLDDWGVKPGERQRPGYAPCGAPPDLIAEVLPSVVKLRESA